MYNDILALEADNSHTLNWFVNAAHKVNPGIKSQIKSILTIDKGSIDSSSTKEKQNARSSTESISNSADDCMPKVMRAKKF